MARRVKWTLFLLLIDKFVCKQPLLYRPQPTRKRIPLSWLPIDVFLRSPLPPLNIPTKEKKTQLKENSSTLAISSTLSSGFFLSLQLKNRRAKKKLNKQANKKRQIKKGVQIQKGIFCWNPVKKRKTILRHVNSAAIITQLSAKQNSLCGWYRQFQT